MMKKLPSYIKYFLQSVSVLRELEITEGETSSVTDGLGTELGSILHSSFSRLENVQFDSCMRIPQRLPTSTPELLYMYLTCG